MSRPQQRYRHEGNSRMPPSFDFDLGDEDPTFGVRGGQLRLAGRGRKPVFRSARSSNPARKSAQKQRVESYRAEKSSETTGELSLALRRNLFPGTKSVSDTLEQIATFKAITLTVTTRAIGFSTFQTFRSIYQFENVVIRGNIYQLYRVGLALFQAKVELVQRSVKTIQDNIDDFVENPKSEDFIATAKTDLVVPDQISSIINQLGQIKVNDALYIPNIAKDTYTQENVFIPRSEQVTYSNLRQTVDALADPQTPVLFRRNFYRNNPIPGCIWQGAPENPVLVNNEEILPLDYQLTDLSDDICDIRFKFNYLNKKAPTAISFEDTGTKAQLVCNAQSGLRMSDRAIDQSLIEYYATMKIEGNITEYSNLERLTSSEQVDGALALLGERPLLTQCIYPVYLMRDSRASKEFTSLKYKNALNLKYTY